MSALTVMGMTRAANADVSGRILFDGVDLLQLPPRRAASAIRGTRIAMIFQDPLSSLHPLYRVGWQIAEAMRAHERRLAAGGAGSARSRRCGTVGDPEPGGARLDAIRTSSPAACASA